MMEFARVACCVVLLFIGLVSSHSYLTEPISRGNQGQTQTGCRGPSCTGPCERPAAQARAPITVARGGPISVKWPRNNHPGGFIRISWALTASSDDQAQFDQNVQLISCYEVGDSTCRPASTSDPNGGDPAGAGQKNCFVDIVAPAHLTDGLWTMQWAWYGGGYALGDYWGCVDFQVSGGTLGPKAEPYFQGGDYANPGGNACKYFNTDYLGACPSEPCNNPPSPGQHNGLPLMNGNFTVTNPVTPPTPPPTPAPTPPPVTPPPPPPATLPPVTIPSTPSPSGEEENEGKVPCVSDDDCDGGICGIDQFCHKTPSSGGLGSGGVAAIVMAMLVLLIVGAVVLFFITNKKEVPYMKPFRGRV